MRELNLLDLDLISGGDWSVTRAVPGGRVSSFSDGSTQMQLGGVTIIISGNGTLSTSSGGVGTTVTPPGHPIT